MLSMKLRAVPRRTAGLCLSPCELSLCYYYKLNNMIYGFNIVNICMSDILACVECFVCHCIALRWGVTQAGKFHYWALLTPSCDHFFKYRRRTWGWDASGALEAKKCQIGLILYFLFLVKLWARDPVLYKL